MTSSKHMQLAPGSRKSLHSSAVTNAGAAFMVSISVVTLSVLFILSASAAEEIRPPPEARSSQTLGRSIFRRIEGRDALLSSAELLVVNKWISENYPGSTIFSYAFNGKSYEWQIVRDDRRETAVLTFTDGREINARGEIVGPKISGSVTRFTLDIDLQTNEIIEAVKAE